ncbi:MAG: helix-turn-helix domain-containing protein, partial [Planctomycetota bacterium]
MAAVDLDPPVRVLVADSTIIDHAWDCPLRDPFWRVYLNDATGAAVLHWRGRHRLAPGLLHLIPPWGDFHASCTGSLRHWYVHADCGDWADGCFPLPVAVPVTDRQRQVFRDLAGDQAWQPTGRLRLRALVLDALAEAVQQLPVERLRRLQVAGGDQVDRARRFIAAHLSHALSLGQIADQAGVSASHLNHCFRRRLGRSVMRYVRERRVAAAAERLLCSDADIETIAAELGFANRFHFSRVFARVIGSGPAAYRSRELDAAKRRPVHRLVRSCFS